jgi:hypothetical protein
LLGRAEITQSNFDVPRWPYFTDGGQKFRRSQDGGARNQSNPCLRLRPIRSRIG